MTQLVINLCVEMQEWCKLLFFPLSQTLIYRFEDVGRKQKARLLSSDTLTLS